MTHPDPSRPNRDLARAVDLAVQLVRIRGKLAAAVFLMAYGADLRVTARVLAEPDRRRPVAPPAQAPRRAHPRC